jgi:hypothetical protein
MGGRHPVPACVRGVRRGPVALLRDVCARPRPTGAAVVPSVRPAVAHGRRSVPRLPTGVDRVRPLGVRVSGTGAGGRPSPEVLGMAWGRGGARIRSGRDRSAACRRRDLGAARAPAAGRARIRSGSRARAGAGTQPPAPGGRLRPPGDRHRSTVAQNPRGAAPGDGGCLRAHPASAAAPTAPLGRRRLHDRSHHLCLRRSARPGRRARDPRAHGVPLLHGPAAGSTGLAPAVKPCLYSRGAPVRVCGCPGTNPGSRCQPRAKRPT